MPAAVRPAGPPDIPGMCSVLFQPVSALYAVASSVELGDHKFAPLVPKDPWCRKTCQQISEGAPGKFERPVDLSWGCTLSFLWMLGFLQLDAALP